MRPLYSRSFYQGAAAERGSIAPVPAGVLWVVRDIDVVTPASASGVVAVGAAGLGWWWTVEWTSQQSDRWYGWRGRQVLNAGQAINIYAIAGTTMFISGYELTVV